MKVDLKEYGYKEPLQKINNNKFNLFDVMVILVVGLIIIWLKYI